MNDEPCNRPPQGPPKEGAGIGAPVYDTEDFSDSDWEGAAPEPPRKRRRTDAGPSVINQEVAVDTQCASESSDGSESESEFCVSVDSGDFEADPTFLRRELDRVAELIERSRRIVVLTGAGISRAAGIPVFRGANGLFEQLLKEFPELHDPTEALDALTLEYNPELVFAALGKLWPRPEWRPTVAHYFLRLLAEKGKLLRLYTQNIDDLDIVSGVTSDRLVRLHGNFDSVFYEDEKGEKRIVRNRAVVERTRKIVAEGGVPVVHPFNPSLPVALGPGAPRLSTFVRPDVVLYHDDVTRNIDVWYRNDVLECDLVLVIGTSLTVAPASKIALPTDRCVPRVWVNCRLPPHSFDSYLMMQSDEMAWSLAERLGWTGELERLGGVRVPDALRVRKCAGLATSGRSGECLDSQSSDSANCSGPAEDVRGVKEETETLRGLEGSAPQKAEEAEVADDDDGLARQWSSETTATPSPVRSAVVSDLKRKPSEILDASTVLGAIGGISQDGRGELGTSSFLCCAADAGVAD